MGRWEEGWGAGYRKGFDDGLKAASATTFAGVPLAPAVAGGRGPIPGRKKRKLSAWNKFVKANSKKPRFVYRNGKLNLKKMGVAFRKTPAGKKKK